MNFFVISRRIILLFVVIVLSTRITYGQSKSLTYFLNQAYQHDPQLAASQRNMEVARLGKQINRAMFRKPVLNGDGLALFAPVHSNWGFSEAITNGGEFDALLNLSYPIWQGNSLDAYDMVSTAQSKQAGFNLRFRKHELRTQVTAAYIRVYGDQHNISYLRNLHRLLQQQLNQLEPLVQNGIIQITDLEQIRLEDSQIRNRINSANSQLAQDQSSVNQLCGLPDTTGFQVTEPPLQLNTSPDSLDNINDSHFLQTFSIDSLSLSAQQKVNDTQYLPHLDALVNGGLSSASLDKAYNHFGFTAGLQLTWKLWDGGQKSLQHQQTRLHLENVRDQKDFEKNRLLQQRNSLRNTLTSLLNRIDNQKQQVSGYRKLLDTYRIEIGKGIRSVTDYVTVFRLYLDAQNSLNSLQIQRLQTINKLNYWNW